MKLSKYNYFTKNRQDELLLFNTITGVGSLIKIPKKYVNSVEAVLSGNNGISDLKESIYTQLVSNNYIIPDSMDEEAQFRKVYIDKVADSQLLLTILPTEQCNFRCKYCYESSSDKRMSKEVQNSILKFLKKNMYKYTSLHVAWFGGEPLLAMETIEYMTVNIKKICAFYKKPYTASITTNGFLLNEECFKRLLKCNVIYYQITLDGTKEIHDIQRPHKESNISTYDVIINNLVDIKKKVKSNIFRITLRSNFSKLNIGKIEEYKKEFNKLFGDDKRYQFFVRPVMDWGGCNIEKFKENLLATNFIDELYERIMNIDCKLNYIYNDFLDNAGAVCEAGMKNSYVIISNGDIYKCTCDFEEKPKAKIGKLLTSGEMHIDKNLESTWICNPQRCQEDCFYAPICLKEACPAIRVLGETNKNKCPLEKRNLSKILQILDEENKLFRRLNE